MRLRWKGYHGRCWVAVDRLAHGRTVAMSMFAGQETRWTVAPVWRACKT